MLPLKIVARWVAGHDETALRDRVPPIGVAGAHEPRSDLLRRWGTRSGWPGYNVLPSLAIPHGHRRVKRRPSSHDGVAGRRGSAARTPSVRLQPLTCRHVVDPTHEELEPVSGEGVAGVVDVPEAGLADGGSIGTQTEPSR